MCAIRNTCHSGKNGHGMKLNHPYVSQSIRIFARREEFSGGFHQHFRDGRQSVVRYEICPVDAR